MPASFRIAGAPHALARPSPGARDRCASVNGEAAAPIVGRASVIDGDTIEIRGERLRLFGPNPEVRGSGCGEGGSCRCSGGFRPGLGWEAVVVNPATPDPEPRMDAHQNART